MYIFVKPQGYTQRTFVKTLSVKLKLTYKKLPPLSYYQENSCSSETDE